MTGTYLKEELEIVSRIKCTPQISNTGADVVKLNVPDKLIGNIYLSSLLTLSDSKWLHSSIVDAAFSLFELEYKSLVALDHTVMEKEALQVW